MSAILEVCGVYKYTVSGSGMYKYTARVCGVSAYRLRWR